LIWIKLLDWRRDRAAWPCCAHRVAPAATDATGRRLILLRSLIDLDQADSAAQQAFCFADPPSPAVLPMFCNREAFVVLFAMRIMIA
jgi:hypothetical protein